MAEEEVLRAKIIVDVKDAIAAYTSARQEHVSMVTALNTGAGALAATGAAITGVGVGIAAGLMVAVNAAGEFERKLDFFSAVSNATVGEMEAIRAKALELGADTIYSADQVADSFTELAKSGVDAQGILEGIGEAVTNLGAATDIPLADAAASLTTILNTFGIAAEDSVAVVDKLAGAANSSSIDVQDLITTMTYAGSSAALMGVSFEDVNTAIALLGEAGIKGSKAGTGLRQMFDKLAAPTKAGSEALRELGIVTDEAGNKLLDAEGKMIPLPKVLDTINTALSNKNLNAAQKMDILGQIFPITSLPTILQLLEGGSAAMERLNGEINKTTAMDIASERLDNLSGDVEVLRGNFDTLLINIGATQQALARGLVQALTGVVDWLNSLSPEMLGFIVGLAQIAAGALILFGVLTMFAGGLLKILSLFLVLRDVLGMFPKALPAVASAFRVMWAAILGPIGLVIAIIGALVAVLVWFFTKTEEGKQVWAEIVKVFEDTFKTLEPAFAALGKAFGALLPALGEVAGTLGGALASALVAISPLIVIIAEIIANVLVAALSVVVPALTWLAEVLNGPLGVGILIIVGLIGAWIAVQWALNIALTANPIGLLIMAIAALIAIIVAIVAAIIWVANETTFFQDVWANLASFFTTIWTEVGRFFEELWTNLVSFFTGIWSAISTSATTAWNQISSFFTTIWTNISNFFIGIWEGIVAFFTPILEFIGGLIKFWFEAYVNIMLIFAAVVVTVFNFIRDVFVNIWNSIVAFLTPIIQFISDIITNTINFIAGIWNTVWTEVSRFFTEIWNNMIAFLVPIILNIQNFITNALNTINGIWNSIWSAISSFFMTIWNNLVSFVSGVISNIQSFISGFLNTVNGIWTSIWSAISNFFKTIWQGFIGAVQGPVNTIMGIVGGIQGRIMGFFSGVGSWLLRVGKDLIQGLINGITSMFQGVINAIGNVVNGAIDWAKGVLGMASPSKVFRAIGVDTIMGMIIGVKKTGPQLERTMGIVANSVDQFYDQVYAAREMDIMTNLESQMSVDTFSKGQANQLALMNEKLEEVMAMPRNQYNIDAEINNPTPEEPSESIAKTIRKVSTPGGQR